MMAPFAWAAPSGQAPTPGRGSAALRRDGLDGECARQAIIVAPRCCPAPLNVWLHSTDYAAAYPTASATPYSERVAEPEAPLRTHQNRRRSTRYRVASFNYRDGKPFKVRAPAQWQPLDPAASAGQGT